MSALALASACFVLPVRAQQNLSLDPAVLGDLRSAWQTIMTNLYGPYDKAAQCWRGQDAKPEECMRPHKLEQVTVDGSRQVFIVTASYGAEGCHACAGLMGLFLLEERDGKLEVVARNSGVEPFGSWGDVPAEENFKLAEIGPSKRGWVIETGWTGQGITSGHNVIYARIAESIVPIGSYQFYLDDSGAAEGETTYHDLAPAFRPDPGRIFYDIELKPGEKNNAPNSAPAYTVRFDSVPMAYREPPELLKFFEGE